MSIKIVFTTVLSEYFKVGFLYENSFYYSGNQKNIVVRVL